MRSVPSVTVSAHAVSGDKHLAGVSVAPKHTPTISIGLRWKQQSFLPTLEEKTAFGDVNRFPTGCLPKGLSFYLTY